MTLTQNDDNNIKSCCYFYLQYNKQHIIPLEEVKLESLEDEGRKYYIRFYIL